MKFHKCWILGVAIFSYCLCATYIFKRRGGIPFNQLKTYRDIYIYIIEVGQIQSSGMSSFTNCDHHLSNCLVPRRHSKDFPRLGGGYKAVQQFWPQQRNDCFPRIQISRHPAASTVLLQLAAPRLGTGVTPEQIESHMHFRWHS